jgi:hypothetical protein
MTQPQPAGDLRQQIHAGPGTLGRHTQASRAVFFGDGISPSGTGADPDDRDRDRGDPAALHQELTTAAK